MILTFGSNGTALLETRRSRARAPDELTGGTGAAMPV
jgi:hypothetical protein